MSIIISFYNSFLNHWGNLKISMFTICAAPENTTTFISCNTYNWDTNFPVLEKFTKSSVQGVPGS